MIYSTKQFWNTKVVELHEILSVRQKFDIMQHFYWIPDSVTCIIKFNSLSICPLHYTMVYCIPPLQVQILSHLLTLGVGWLMNSRWTRETAMASFQEDYIACRTSNSSYDLTDSSLVTVDYIPATLLGLASSPDHSYVFNVACTFMIETWEWLAFFVCSKTADQARAWSYIILCNCV